MRASQTRPPGPDINGLMDTPVPRHVTAAMSHTLGDVYTHVADLRTFFMFTVRDPGWLDRFHAGDAGRLAEKIVGHMIDNPGRHQNDLFRCVLETTNFQDLGHLRRHLHQGPALESAARASLDAFRDMVYSEPDLFNAVSRIEQNLRSWFAARLDDPDYRERLDGLRRRWQQANSGSGGGRGHLVFQVLSQLVDLSWLDADLGMREHEQVFKGGFHLDGTSVSLEGTWVNRPASKTTLHHFKNRLAAKLEPSLGLYLSLEGFTPDTVSAHTKGASYMLLADGADIAAVLQGDLHLNELLMLKRRHAARTGDIYLRASALA